jgi:hypothetical protein
LARRTTSADGILSPHDAHIVPNFLEQEKKETAELRFSCLQGDFYLKKSSLQ